ncbi:MAG: hypothetical protein BWY10_02434 [Chloroflexi bacterium ADurb.Bin180]|nr:MAG: hypothetical protein BWY10_02434 [Chloroflexi bacterium ADurb.Bin180]
MRISTILDHIDSGHMALPQFQRGYVWNRDQVRSLFTSLYRRYPVGALLVWVTPSETADYKGDSAPAPGVVKLLLDGQQRITSIYGVVRGRPPPFFEGNAATFTGLWFHVDTETFEFYQPQKMSGDPHWIDVTALLKKGFAGLDEANTRLSQATAPDHKQSSYVGRLSRLLGITDIELHEEEVTGADKTLDVVVDIFNRANSGGTKLSKGDLALARICSRWPNARVTMNQSLRRWADSGYNFNLDWLLRSVNTVLTGEAKFSFLHDKTAQEVQEGLNRAVKRIDTCLNLIGGRLGLDHDQVLFGRFAIPVMVHYLDQHSGPLGASKQDKLLFWYLQAGMWGRFSGSTETYIDQDLAALEGDGNGLDRLIQRLRLWHGSLSVEPADFTGWSLGARFYPLLYLLTRMGEARDWGDGLPLKTGLLGKMNRLEVHHIFPRAQLYKLGHNRPEVNALANYCFLKKDTNLAISDQPPEEYFPEIEQRHPAALASQWIPCDSELWRLSRYHDFLEARRELLAAETNKRLIELLHGDVHWLEGVAKLPIQPAKAPVLGGITSEAEELEIEALQNWMRARALPPGEQSFELSDPTTGQQQAVFDLAWARGVQEELSEPVALLLNESRDVLELANRAGFRPFTSTEAFKEYIVREILGGNGAERTSVVNHPTAQGQLALD